MIARKWFLGAVLISSAFAHADDSCMSVSKRKGVQTLCEGADAVILRDKVRWLSGGKLYSKHLAPEQVSLRHSGNSNGKTLVTAVTSQGEEISLDLSPQVGHSVWARASQPCVSFVPQGTSDPKTLCRDNPILAAEEGDEAATYRVDGIYTLTDAVQKGDKDSLVPDRIYVLSRDSEGRKVWIDPSPAPVKGVAPAVAEIVSIED